MCDITISVSANLTTDKITTFTVLCRLQKHLNISINLSKYHLKLLQLQLLLSGTLNSNDKLDSVIVFPVVCARYALGQT